jgi:hypothetical protein
MRTADLRRELSDMLHEWYMPSLHIWFFPDQHKYLFAEPDISRQPFHQLSVGDEFLKLYFVRIWVQFTGRILLHNLCEFTHVPKLFGSAGANDLSNLSTIIFCGAFRKLHSYESNQLNELQRSELRLLHERRRQQYLHSVHARLPAHLSKYLLQYSLQYRWLFSLQ